jgi:uncharacterized membrane protein (DUF2068 family)
VFFSRPSKDILTQLVPLHRRHNTWLIAIAAFKLAQAMLFAVVAMGALGLLHKDVGGLMAQLADYLRFNPESRVVYFVLDKASRIDDRLLTLIGEIGFLYAGMDLLEGIGLYLEKTWAEYLTLLITASFLPWEILEIFRRITPMRVGLLAVNALVFFYLLKLVMARGKQKRGPAKSASDA